MHTALRPYMTTGIAIVGASVIAVAPVTVPPPDLPAVEVAAVDSVRSVTADVELTGLVDALIAAIPQSVEFTAQMLFETYPGLIQDQVAAGHLAHLAWLAAASFVDGPAVPFIPFLIAAETELPLPIGTYDGLLRQSFLLAIAGPAMMVELVEAVADVIDGVSTPADFPVAVQHALTLAIQKVTLSIQKIVAAVGGALPLVGLAEPVAAAEAEQLALPGLPDLGSLPAALVAALGQAVTSSIDWYTFQIPSRFLGHIAAGEFAHLPLLLAGIPAISALTPIAPFLQALMEELPMPFGTIDGLISQGVVLGVEVGLGLPLGIGNLVANVFDSGMSPADAFSSSVDLINQAVVGSIAAVGKIVAALGGSLPIGALMAEEAPNEALTLAAPVDTSTIDDPNVVPPSVNSPTLQAPVDTVTLTVDSSVPDDAATTDAVTTTTATTTGESADESQTSAGDDVTSNGATDLSDGNKAEPGPTGGESSGADDNDSDVGSETDTTAEDATAADAGDGTAGDGSGDAASGE